MNKRKSAFIAILLVTGVTAISGVAIAQENTTETSNDNNVVMQIDDQLTLVDYSFEGGEVIITIKAGYNRPIVLSDMFVRGSGAQQIPRKRVMLSSGTNRITFDVTSWNGMQGVSIASSNGAIAITDQTPSGFSLSGTFDGETLVIVFGVASLFGIGLVLVMSYKKQIDYTSDISREL